MTTMDRESVQHFIIMAELRRLMLLQVHLMIFDSQMAGSNNVAASFNFLQTHSLEWME